MIEKKERSLYLKEIEIYSFEYPIQQVIEIEDVLICRVEPPSNIVMNENVFGISRTGKMLWQVEKMDYVYQDSPYTNICYKDSKLLLSNWDGLNVIVNFKTGVIEDKEYSR